MRRLLPSLAEVLVFATVAVMGALVVRVFAPSTSDLRFAALACPVFLVAAVMGLRKSPAWTERENEEV